MEDVTVKEAKEFKIQIPTEIVRDKELKAIEFVLLGKLIQCYYMVGKKVDFKVNHSKIMQFMSIKDNDTFKKTFNGLCSRGYILNEIDKLPRKGMIDVELNPKIIPELNKGGVYTQLIKSVLDNSIIDTVGYIGVRLLYYYKSYINEKEPLKQYCFASEETIAEDLGITKVTVINYQKKLKKAKFIKIDKHILETELIYTRVSDKEMVAYTKYNNHYFLRLDKLVEHIEKNSSIVGN
jgi:hypothetical protein